MDNQQVPNPNKNEAQQYFYPYEEPKKSSLNKEQMVQYGNKFHYYAVQAWPTVTNVINFFFYWIKKTIGGIISIGKDQIMNK
jgi:hypothetical protein